MPPGRKPALPDFLYGLSRQSSKTVHIIAKEHLDAGLCGTAVSRWLISENRPDRKTICARCRTLRRRP